MFYRRFFIIVILHGLAAPSVSIESGVDVDCDNEGKHQSELLPHESEMPQDGQYWVDVMTGKRQSELLPHESEMPQDGQCWVHVMTGKRQSELLPHESEMPQDGQCWVHVMTAIQAGCKELTRDTQSRLALAYLNCFLQQQGLEMYSCHQDVETCDCTKTLRESDRGSFTTFFTHTQNICYFLQAQIWNEETIIHLADRSSQVAAQLEASQRLLQEDMLDSQNKSLHKQEQLIQVIGTLRRIINSSSEELKTSTTERRQMFEDVLNMQSTILREISSICSGVFYALSLLVSYLLTSTERLSGARVWLFVVMTVNIIVEQPVTCWFVGRTTDNELLYWLQWRYRNISVVVSMVILGVCALMYRDVNEHNNQLLTKIYKQTLDIMRLSAKEVIEVKD